MRHDSIHSRRAGQLPALLALVGFLLGAPVAAQRGVEPPAGTTERKPPSPGSKIIQTFKYRPITWRVPEIGREVERLVLPNGMVVYLKEDHALPKVEVRLLVRTGEIYEPAEKHGVARLTGTVMRTGGTERHSPEEFDRELEQVAASLSAVFRLEEGVVSLEVLSRHLPKGLELMAEMLRAPKFDQKRLDLEKSRIQEEIRRRNDDPGEVVAREYAKRLYPGHPYGRTGDYTQTVVAGIGRDDLVAWHRAFVQPNNLFLGVSGDFKKGELMPILEKVFGDWPKADLSLPSIPLVKKESRLGVFIFPKELNQTYLQLGHLGVARDNPDRYAIQVMNFILGAGSFTSRINEKVRNDEGLAYSVGSRYELDSRDLGTFMAYGQTKVGSTHRAIKLILGEIAKVRTTPVGEKELEGAKEAIMNRFLFEFTSAHQIVTKLMGLEYRKMPADFYKRFREKIQQVTAADVLRVAKTHLRPDEFTFVLVGNPKAFDKSPDDLGKVEVLPLADASQEHQERQ